MSTPSRFDDNEYKNWLKCSLALILFKEGLHDYIDTEVKKLHADIHRTVSSIVGPPVQNQCSMCTWKDIKWNKGTWTMKCQNKICDQWLSEILANHTDPQNRHINWKNADITRWPTDAYEVAKVYMPKGQEKTKNLPQDFDAPAVLSLLKYCVWFTQKIPNTNIISDLIDIRNEVMHSGGLRVTDFKKDNCIDQLVQLLFHLSIRGDVLTELQKAKREDIDIKFRETEVRALCSLVMFIKGRMDSLHDVQQEFTDDQEKVKTRLTAIQNAQTQQRQEMQDVKENTLENRGKVVTMETDIQGIKSQVEQLSELYQKIKSFLANNPDIDDKNISENIKKIEKTISNLQSKQQETENKMTFMRREIKGMKRKFAEIEVKMDTKEPTITEEMESLHNELLHRYKSFRVIPFSIDEKEEVVPLEYLYTEVVMKCEDKENAHAIRSSNRENRMEKKDWQAKKFTTYEQMFGWRKRTILTGLSGSGKSTFCRKIVYTWCKLHENKKIGTSVDVKGSSTCDSTHVTEPSTHDSSDVITDENVLLKFDLLFYINSPAVSNETKLTAVLCNQCIRREQEKERNGIQNKLSKLLNNQSEKILVIFDGLDEMGHTPKFLADVFKRDLYPGISVLMVMRPWKISRLGLKPLSHYDLLLEIQGFSMSNALKFVKKVVDMNSHMDGEMSNKYLSRKDKTIVASFKSIPLLLLFLAHIWYRKKSLLNKYKDLYSQIIDFLIRRCVEKTGNNSTVTVSDEESLGLHVKMFWETHLSSACKAAYHFLSEIKNGPSVVIQRKELLKELGENSEVKLRALLDCGIMSEVDFFSPLEKNVSVMFLHMSIQEYLASIHLVQNEDAFQKFLKSLTTLNDVRRYENLFICISGLNASQAHKAFTRICEVCDKDTLVSQYRDGSHGQVIYSLNDMYKKCVDERNEQTPIEISDIIISSETDFKFRSCFVKSLDLRGIWYNGVLDMTNLTSLRLSVKDIKVSGVPDMSTLTNLTYLSVSDVSMSAESSRSLCSIISTCTHLEKLILTNLALPDGELDLSMLTNLTYIYEFCVTMTEECRRFMCNSISGCTQMKTLYLEYSSLHGVLNLSTLTNLTYLNLYNVILSEECSRSLCSSISVCTHLDRLVMNNINLHDGVLDLSSLTSLIYLNMTKVTMSEECGRSLCSSISRCTHLESVTLTDVTIHNGVLDLKTLKDLKYVQIWVTMSSECTKILDQSFQHCPRLEFCYTPTRLGGDVE